MFQTLYSKISTVFVLLLIIFGLVLIYISFSSSRSYVCEATQKLNFKIAGQFAERCEPMFQDSIHYRGLHTKVMEFAELNPNADIFLLDSLGNVLESSVDLSFIQLKKVNLDPVKKFLEPNSYKHFPIFGTDPLMPQMNKIFSAAKMTFGNGNKGYLYVTLASARTDLGEDNIITSYILRSGSLAIFAVLFFAGIIGLFLFFVLTKQVHNVTEAVKEFSKGNYNQRIKQPSNQDEVAQLAAAFNTMAETIEHNVRELEKNDQMRRDLIENISHDLRSPLTSIQGYLETIQIKSKELQPAQQAEFLEISLKNVIHLNQLVNQLFELSKLDAKQITPNPEPFSLTELSQDVILKFHPQADEKNIKVESTCPENIPFVLADVAMMERLLSNLLDNAIKYSHSDSTIKIELSVNDSEVKFAIIDQGPGISSADLPHIFNRFYKADKSRSHPQHSSGLGLAIAKKITEAHNSSLKVKSELGKGTTFYFVLPIVNQKEATRFYDTDA